MTAKVESFTAKVKCKSFDDLANWDETKLTLYLCFKKHFVNPPHLTQESMDKTIKQVHCLKDTHGYS